MPRIAAALGSFLLVACAIGVNTARYPVVWEMVGAKEPTVAAETPLQASAPEPSLPSSAVTAPVPANPALPVEPAASPVSPAPAQVPPVSTEPPAPEKRAAPEPQPAAPPIGQPAMQPPAAATEPKGTEPGPEPVVRIVDARGVHRPPLPPASAETSPEPALDPGVERLPPVDQVEPAAPRPADPPLPGGMVPVYPNTATP